MTGQDEHPAELIRRAETRMRKLAGAATPGPWEASHRDVDSPTLEVLSREVDCMAYCLGGSPATPSAADAEHIASWHPLVALAVAGWLEGRARDADCARREDSVWGPWNLDYCQEPGGVEEALKVARAYLGETAGTETSRG